MSTSKSPATGNGPDPLIDAIIHFWISDDPDDAEKIKSKYDMWFKATPEHDELIREKHGDDVERAYEGKYRHFESSSRGRLALILLFDQMPRNIYRRTARAFAADHLALAQSRALVDSGADLEMHVIERSFVYMPLEHAEDRVNQKLSVRCFTRLAADAPPEHRELLESYPRHATEHREIVERFGRFPHRNRVLERASTADEIAFLEDGGPDFGQGGGSGAADSKKSR